MARFRRQRAVVPAGMMRLQKFLSDAGVASRRHAEELILEGRVLVNDEVIGELPAFVDPRKDVVIANGARVRILPNDYFLLHKPKGVVCTNRDPEGRTRAIDLLPPFAGRLNVVGRLDAESSGLLLMTNDGELAARITHPSHGVAKVYRVVVKGRVESDLPAKMKKGVYLAEGRAQASDVRIVHADTQQATLEMTLREGRIREVRRMLARLGHPVRRLTRIKIGPLSLKGLPVGGARRLSDDEIKALREAVADVPLMADRAPKPRRRPGRVAQRDRARQPAATSSASRGAAPQRGARKPAARGGQPDRPAPQAGRSARRGPDDGPRRRVID